MASDGIIFDSSVLIDQFRSNRFTERISQIAGVIRMSSVVLAELLRGAKGKEELAALHSLERNLMLLSPTEKNWVESGKILAEIQNDRGFDLHKMRELHFDVLIALTVQSYGATLITSNRADFELIRRYKDFELEIW